MQEYPYKTISCNGRIVLIDDIVQAKVRGESNFENSLFTFMHQWINNKQQFILSTSGSTGPPKSITVTREQMLTSADLTAQALNLSNGQTALICLNAEYIAGKMMIVRSLRSGLKIIAVDPSSNPLEHVHEQIDFTAMVPLQVHELIRTHHHTFHNIRTVIVGGGNMATEDIAHISALPCRFYATYGMTETVSHVALRRLNGPDAPGYYTALPGISFTSDGRGCLVINWPAFEKPVITNDLVELLDRQRFIWMGRWDNIINSGGHKIIPERVENTIAELLERRHLNMRFFITSIPDPRLGNKVVLIMECERIDQINNDLIIALKSSLQAFEVPKAILSCACFVETQTGKINRNATLELAISNNRSPE
ncbi:AMP-binding protein [Chryseolinea sp. T2]|uniref:AMP-binding protein n=1 Tax=Chryseolinea sp. T2 TaxID=3129255 RepID=UPI00307694F5